jgi:folate-binding protein YgfZ
MGEPTTAGAAPDYRALRETGGAVDLSAWMVLRLRGPDTRAFLQGLASQDLESARPGEALPTFFLNEKGRPVALAWVEIGEGASSALVIADEGARSALRAHFERFRIMEDVEIDGPEEMPPLIGFAGPNRRVLLRETAGTMPGATAIESELLSFLLPTPERSSTNPRQPAPSHFADPASFEAWRLATGIPRTGIDIDLDRIATELSFPEAISLTKGCYVGQEIVARTSNRGQVRRHRVGFRFDWDGRPIPARTELRAGGVAAGYVTSTAPEPGTDQGIGMGYLSVDALQPSLEVHAVEGPTTRRVRQGAWPL